MATQSPFHLENAIQQWQISLRERSSLAAEDRNELETHLRDSIENLMEASLSPEEAFLIAERRLGNPDTLAKEFHKIKPPNPWPHRVQWILVGYLLFLGTQLFAGVTSKLAAAIGSFGDLSLGSTGSFAATAFLLTWVIQILWLYRLASGRFGTWAQRWSTWAICYPGRTIVGFTALFALLYCLEAAGQVALAQSFSPSHIGTLVVHRAIAQAFGMAGLIAVSVLVIKRIQFYHR